MFIDSLGRLPVGPHHPGPILDPGSARFKYKLGPKEFDGTPLTLAVKLDKPLGRRHRAGPERSGSSERFERRVWAVHV